MAAITQKIAGIFSLPSGVIKYVREAREELKKVSWPSRETTIRYTVIVAVSSVALGILTGGIDYILAAILERLVL